MSKSTSALARDVLSYSLLVAALACGPLKRVSPTVGPAGTDNGGAPVAPGASTGADVTTPTEPSLPPRPQGNKPPHVETLQSSYIAKAGDSLGISVLLSDPDGDRIGKVEFQDPKGVLAAQEAADPGPAWALTLAIPPDTPSQVVRARVLASDGYDGPGQREIVIQISGAPGSAGAPACTEGPTASTCVDAQGNIRIRR